MPMTVAQMIVPARDRETSARFFAQMFGLSYDGPVSHFAPVRVSPDLVVVFEMRVSFDHHHYSFHVSDQEFDEIFGRVRQEGLRYGSRPQGPHDLEVRERRSGRAFHFHDPSGHLFEVLS